MYIVILSAIKKQIVHGDICKNSMDKLKWNTKKNVWITRRKAGKRKQKQTKKKKGKPKSEHIDNYVK